VADVVYLLCTGTSALCCGLLLRQYRRLRAPLLFWSGVAFAGLALSNALVFTDYVVLPQVDLSLARTATAFVSIVLLLYGLIWDGN
jgi:hypothetical protein